MDLTTPFGGAGIKTNVGPPASGNNLLTTAGIGLAISSLVITVAAIAIPFFNTGEKKGQQSSNRGMGQMHMPYTTWTVKNGLFTVQKTNPKLLALVLDLPL